MGLGAVSASAMSSCDSCILASSSVFATNIYKAVLRRKASEREMLWVIRIAIVMTGSIGCMFAIIGHSTYIFNLIAAELAYTVLFPQLICIFYFPKTNTYGGVVGYVLAVVFRFIGGDEILNFPGLFLYPGNYYDDDGQLVQGFPVKTFATIVDLLSTIFVSYLTDYLYRKNIITPKMDFAKCFTKLKPDKLKAENEIELEQKSKLVD